MQDMIVRLYDLPDYSEDIKTLAEQDIFIRRAMAPDKNTVLNFIGEVSSPYAKSEADIAFSRQPISIYIATFKSQIIGYACFDATYMNFFGPTAVLEEFRGRGIGKALLLTCLNQMYYQGYAYAIIGGVGPWEFYKKTCDAMFIDGSNPGVYKDFLANLK